MVPGGNQNNLISRNFQHESFETADIFQKKIRRKNETRWFSSHRQKLSPVEVCSNLSPATLTTKADTFRLLDLILRMLIYFMVMQTQAAYTSKIIVSIEGWF